MEGSQERGFTFKGDALMKTLQLETDLREKLEDHVTLSIRNRTSRARNWAGDLGLECDTYQVASRLKGTLKPKVSQGLMKIFRVGIEWERPNIRWLQDAGINVRETGDKHWYWEKYNISGIMDAEIEVIHPNTKKKTWIPFEHKTTSPNGFRAIKKHKDEGISLTKADQPWLRKYPGQLSTYMMFKSVDIGCWFYFEKTSGDYLFWILPLDYEYAETLIKRAERTNTNVMNNHIPDPKYCDSCLKCDFALTLCFPDKDFGPGFDMIESEEVLSKVKRYKDLEAELKEFNALKKELIGKGDSPGLLYKRNAVVGDYIVESKEGERGGYEVKASKYWVTSIKELGGGKEE